LKLTNENNWDKIGMKEKNIIFYGIPNSVRPTLMGWFLMDANGYEKLLFDGLR